MAAWVGPAIVAAVIAAAVSVLGWFVTAYQAIRLDQRRRDEKARDFQIALRAEVRSELAWLNRVGPTGIRERLRERYREDPNFAVLIGELPQAVIFDAIVGEIHILPEDVIDPVVLFMRQRQVVASVARDIRAATFRDLPKERQIEILEDYINLVDELRAAAVQAEEALDSPAP